MHSINDVLSRNAGVLLEKGSHTRALTSIAKLFGLSALLAGTVGVGTGNMKIALPTAAVGSVLYIGAVGKELGTTGLFMPVPFCPLDVGAIARKGVVSGEQSRHLIESDFLTIEERAKLALATTLKPLTIAIDNLPENEQATAYHMVVNALVAGYPAEVANVHHFPALLPVLGGMEGVRTKLSDAMPPSHQHVLRSAEVPAVFSAQPVDTLPAATVVTPVEIMPVAPPVSVAKAVVRKPVEPARPPQPVVQLTALDAIQQSPFTSKIFFGSQRVGKTKVVSDATKALHKKDGVRIFHINLASFGSEDAEYWTHVQPGDSVCCDLSGMDLSTGAYHVDQAVALVNDFYATDNAILVVDEFAYIGSKNGRHSTSLELLTAEIADKIQTFSSTGMKRRKSIWAIAPEFVAGEMTKEALSVKKLQVVMCAISPGHKSCWKDEAGREHALSFDHALYNMVSRNFAITPPPRSSQHSRITYVNGQWLAPGITGKEKSNG